MNHYSKKLYTLRNIGNLKNCRIYNEGLVSPVQAFYSELEIYFKQSIDEGYNIYIINNKPIHNIAFTNDDINYISLEPYEHLKEPSDYYFSENLKFIKKNQYIDYKWLLCENRLDFLFCIPNLDENNKYYYNFIVGIKQSIKLYKLINHQFNLVEVDNLQYLNQMFFDSIFLEKLFKIKDIEDENTVTTLFKDNVFTSYEISLWNVTKGKDFPIKKYIEMCCVRLSFHFYYNSDIHEMCAYTNFLELVGGKVAYNTEEGLQVECIPYPVSFLDLINHNDTVLYFVSWEIEKFHWTVIDSERNYLSFLSETIKQFDWDIPVVDENSENAENQKKFHQEMYEFKKNRLKNYIKRLKEYRKLLKDNKKKN